MITNVSLVSVWVTDLDEALAFYTEMTFGSATISDGSPWVTPRSPNSICI